MGNVPRHIAVIMDGNGRWATQRGASRLEGHVEGVKSLRSCVQSCLDLGVRYLTAYAFSSENWGRPEDEVEGLMTLFCATIARELPDLLSQGVRIRFMGSRKKINADILENIRIAEEMTASNDNLQLIIALDYGSKQELVDAMLKIANDIESGLMKSSEIDENSISDRLYLSDVPDVDLLIRTSGECRISNFMLWQLAYSELLFVDKLWPDFDKTDLVNAVEEFASRHRRFGC